MASQSWSKSVSYVGAAALSACVSGALCAHVTDLGRSEKPITWEAAHHAWRVAKLHPIAAAAGPTGARDAFSTAGDLRLAMGLVDDPADNTPSRWDAEQSPELSSESAMVSWGLGEAFREGKVITGSTPHRLILFSFDDGPDLRYTPQILDALDRFGIKALFFLTASRIDTEKKRGQARAEIAREILRRGHIIGSHTLDHVQLTLVNDIEAKAQLELAERQFVSLFGTRPWLFRPPGGSRSARVDRLVEAYGYTTVMWNLGTGDTQVDSPRAVLSTWKKVLRRRQREHNDEGGIVLLHDIHEWTLDAFVLIVEELQRRNCQLLDEGEELYDIVDDPSLFFEPRDGHSPHGTPSRAKVPDSTMEERQRVLRASTAERCRAPRHSS